MAEYYPLISRAVAGLRAGTPEARRAIYERAHQALVGQLRAMQPPVPEDAIAREAAALEDAVTRVEADLAAAAPPQPRISVPLPPPPAVDTQPAPAVTARPPRSTAPTLGGADRTAMPPRLKPRPMLPPLRPSAPTADVPPVVEPPPIAAATSKNARADHPEPAPVAASPALPTAPILTVGAGVSEAKLVDADPATEPLSTERIREETFRPAAPRPEVRQRPNLRVWIVAAVALAAVVVIAFTAWRLKDNPQELARVPEPTRAAEPEPGKLVERADDPGADAGAADPAVPPVATTIAPAATIAAPQPVDAATIPVAYKAAILVDAPDEPQKVRTYVGTVVWQTETVAQGQNQPVGTVIRADVDVPDAKVKLVMEIRRNTEPQFPASHTIDLRFVLAPDSPLATVKQINVPQMRREDMPNGEALAGIPVTITDNTFLVGLTRGDTEPRNLEMMQTRGWFDIPMLLGTGKASKITFEKGSMGEQIFKQIIDGWKASAN